MHQYSVSNVTGVALVGTTPQTLIQLATPSTRKCRIKQIDFSGSSTTATDPPILVQLIRQTNGGTGTTVTGVPEDPNDPAALITAQITFTVEPTVGTVQTSVVRQWNITPIGSTFAYQLPLGDEPVMAVSSWLGLKCTPGNNQTVFARIQWQE
jgi:hypothetical protein